MEDKETVDEKTVEEETAGWKRKYGTGWIIVLPLVFAAATVYFFTVLHDKNMVNVAKRQYYEKIELTYNLLYEIENLHAACTNREKDSLFNRFIVRAVEEMDKQYGIYGRVIDLDGQLLSTPYLAENEEGLAVLLEAEDFDFETELGFVRDIPAGDRHIVSRNGVRIHLHWLRYPVTREHYYYILLGIVYGRVIDTVDTRGFVAGVTGLVMVIVIGMYVTVYYYRKYKNGLRDVGDEGDGRDT